MSKLLWKHKDNGSIGVATRNSSRTLEEDLKILSRALPEYDFLAEVSDEEVEQADRSKREAWVWDSQTSSIQIDPDRVS
jgi:hypothetical protein